MLAPVNLTVLLAALIIGFAAETCEARLAPSPPSRVAIPIRRLAGQAESSLHPAIVSRHLQFRSCQTKRVDHCRSLHSTSIVRISAWPNSQAALSLPPTIS